MNEPAVLDQLADCIRLGLANIGVTAEVFTENVKEAGLKIVIRHGIDDWHLWQKPIIAAPGKPITKAKIAKSRATMTPLPMKPTALIPLHKLGVRGSLFASNRDPTW